MLTGINQWAFPAEMPAADAMALAAKMGFQSFEVCVGETGPTPLASTESEMHALRRAAEKHRLTLATVGTGLGWQYPMTSPDPEVRRKGVETTAQAMRIAQWLGAHTVLVVPGIVSGEVAYDVALENALGAVRELAPTAEQLKVGVGIENVWNKFLLSPVEMRDFIDQCESDFVGAYVDTGNVILYGYPEQYLRILGPRVRAVHAKDFRASAGNFDGFVMLMEGDVNWPAVVAALREIGFDGPLTAEYGPYAHSLETMLLHCRTALDSIIALAK